MRGCRTGRRLERGCIDGLYARHEDLILIFCDHSWNSIYTSNFETIQEYEVIGQRVNQGQMDSEGTGMRAMKQIGLQILFGGANK